MRASSFCVAQAGKGAYRGSNFELIERLCDGKNRTITSLLL